MGIELYPHNEKAYRAVRKMLDEKGLAAVVHPTGTGKSFIAFKLCEDEPNRMVCWLSPSEYIFETQLENLKRTFGFEPANIKFYTYAKLMMMSDAEMAEIKPDILVLDEFHRAGAEMWGQGVQRLFGMYPNASALGLSATSVRYLDNQRDMADELFGSNVASEMTLGEAIVRGILPEPKYVTTVFKYQQDLERWQKRVDSARAFGIRDEAQKYLDALRRALEQADGLDVIFQKHIANCTGKYIVFCANVEHMREMQSHVSEWFGAIDREPHCYEVYSEDPTTSRDFAAFKADVSKHLKLLFCVDMLNEGVHVPGVSGVILFRPTISPIVYKQQIGRALTAGDADTPLIMDVVNNVENLTSVGALQEEMATAIQRMYLTGEGGNIVTERFRVIEQVQDCHKLFEGLQKALTGTWEQYFQAASAYYAEHGDLNVPKRYAANGLCLGSWITTQRLVRSGRQAGRLTDQQIARLDSIGMVWENRLETAWERNFSYAEQYYAEYGDLMVPVKYVTEDGFRLGVWISNLRTQRTNGEQRTVLTEERIERLDAIGMQWDAVSVRWEQNYLEALQYYQKHGDLNVPAGYKTDSGFSLGAWIRNLRQARQHRGNNRPLSEDQIRRLDAIGMQWDNRYESQWSQAYRDAEVYFRQHGTLDMPVAYRSPDGLALGKWVRRQRYALQAAEGETSPRTAERRALLDKIGMNWGA